MYSLATSWSFFVIYRSRFLQQRCCSSETYFLLPLCLLCVEFLMQGLCMLLMVTQTQGMRCFFSTKF
ncbi:rCG24574 [Rattus norvegicus]|uniref:RCG24574 n=1 Tax=Rattus norvegicus TaxID=10116 RepID=A6JBI9_RAT|nr:rCG24574 [Rattus norvegicus]